MAIRVYRVAVIGPPRAFISSNGLYEGAGKSCLCNRFVRPDGYVETHNSCMSDENWLEDQVTNGDHFIYWGAATKHLPDGTKARFQVVEQTEFYKEVNQQLVPHSSSQDYPTRASAVHFKSSSGGKTAFKYKSAENTVRRIRGPVRNTQLFPNEDFGEKSLGVFGYVCVFDPTLEGQQMENQLLFWSHLLPILAKKKRKIVIACVKCDAVDEAKIQFASSVACHALKKAVPFVEVSARESVNIEEAFFALVGPLKKHKAPKNGKRSLSGYLTFKKAIESRKGDLNRAKDTYRTLLQKRVTAFSSTWNEVLPTIEREPAYKTVLELAGTEGEETVLKMFQLRLIELKLMEASKLHSFHSTSKKLDKGSSQSYQDYLSSAFKGHPDLGNESLYDYVYSPRSSVSDISPSNDSLEVLTEPSLPSSYRNTPDLRGSHTSISISDGLLTPSLTDSRPRSYVFQEPATQTVELFSSATLPRAPPRSKSQLVEPGTSLSNLNYGSEEPPPLPPRAIDLMMPGSLPKLRESHSFVQIIPEDPPKQEAETRRLSNSMDCLLISGDAESDLAKEKRFKELAAEPYLQPVEVKEMMSRITTPPPPLVALSPKSEQSRNSGIFASMRARTKTRPALPQQATIDNAQGSPILSRSFSFEKGHKRSQSNPWILEGSSQKPPELPPPRNTEAPPVPPRPASFATSPGNALITESVRSPIESSLEFASRPPLPPTPRKMAISSEKSPLSARSTKQKSFDENLSSVDDLEIRDSEGEILESPERELFEDAEEDPDDPSNHYARIEDVQKYVIMSSAPLNIPRDKASTIPSSMGATDESTDYGIRRTQTMVRSPVPPGTPKRELPPTNLAPLLPWKRKWKKQRNGPIVHEPPSPSDTLSASPPSQIKMSPSHERKTRPLPPSPTKARRQFSNKSGGNIYEAIDDYRPRRLSSKKHSQDASDKWVPPVQLKLWPKYLEAVNKFFAIPEVKEQWLATLKTVLPDESVESIPHPYANQSMDKGSVIKEEEERKVSGEAELDTDQSTPSPKPKMKHKSSMPITAQDDMILISQPNPISPTHSQSPFVASPKSDSVSPFQKPQAPHSNRITPFQSPDQRQFKKVPSRDNLIQILNQQLNTRDSLSSDSDSDEEDHGSSSSEEDSDLEDSIEPATPQVQMLPIKSGNVKAKVAAFLQTDLDEALGMQASVSTDSDLVPDQSTDLPPPPRPPLPVFTDPTDGVEVVHNVKPSQLIKKRGTPKRRNQNIDINENTRNLSDSGISNCHSQTFEDGFSALPSHLSQNNSESEC